MSIATMKPKRSPAQMSGALDMSVHCPNKRPCIYQSERSSREVGFAASSLLAAGEVDRGVMAAEWDDDECNHRISIAIGVAVIRPLATNALSSGKFTDQPINSSGLRYSTYRQYRPGAIAFVGRSILPRVRHIRQRQLCLQEYQGRWSIGFFLA